MSSQKERRRERARRYGRSAQAERRTWRCSRVLSRTVESVPESRARRLRYSHTPAAVRKCAARKRREVRTELSSGSIPYTSRSLITSPKSRMSRASVRSYSSLRAVCVLPQLYKGRALTPALLFISSKLQNIPGTTGHQLSQKAHRKKMEPNDSTVLARPPDPSSRAQREAFVGCLSVGICPSLRYTRGPFILSTLLSLPLGLSHESGLHCPSAPTSENFTPVCPSTLARFLSLTPTFPTSKKLPGSRVIYPLQLPPSLFLPLSPSLYLSLSLSPSLYPSLSDTLALNSFPLKQACSF